MLLRWMSCVHHHIIRASSSFICRDFLLIPRRFTLLQSAHFWSSLFFLVQWLLTLMSVVFADRPVASDWVSCCLILNHRLDLSGLSYIMWILILSPQDHRRKDIRRSCEEERRGRAAVQCGSIPRRKCRDRRVATDTQVHTLESGFSPVFILNLIYRKEEN